MIVVKGETDYRQIIITNAISKLSITTLLSKNKNRGKIVLKKKQYQYVVDNNSLQKQLNTIQKTE